MPVAHSPEGAVLDQAARVVSRAARGIPADAALREHFAERRPYPGMRRAISRAVFVYFRWQGWLDPKASMPQRIAEAWQTQARFDENPALFKPEALAARAVPGWIKEEMDLPADFLRDLQREPVLWLRARPGKGPKLAAALGKARVFAPAHVTAGTAAIPADAIRFEGTEDLFRAPAFQAGEFEIQDLASQWVSVLAAPKPGETWWDACAGEGGKTLHLADLMANKGVVWATDRSKPRLAVLQKRAKRAQLFNIRVGGRAPRGAIFDGILVDAPCSGVGTWGRNPNARWTTTPDDVRELAAAQLALLDDAAPRLKPGGRLVYAVCTLTRSETTGVAAAFSARHPELIPLPEAGLRIEPQEYRSNGMFIAVWKR